MQCGLKVQTLSINHDYAAIINVSLSDVECLSCSKWMVLLWQLTRTSPLLVVFAHSNGALCTTELLAYGLRRGHKPPSRTHDRFHFDVFYVHIFLFI